MNNKYSLIILDLDGTILNTSKGIFNSINYVINEMNLDEIDQDVLNKFIGPPVYDSFKKYCNLSNEEAMKATELYRKCYWEKGMYDAEIYEGVLDFIKRVKEKNILLAVATLKREDQAIAILKHFNLYDEFDVIVGVDENNSRKKKDTILIAMESLGVHNKEKVLMIGDTLHDSEGANEAGVNFIGITYGFGFNADKDIEGVKIIDCLQNIC